jgi:hypothetical protein
MKPKKSIRKKHRPRKTRGGAATMGSLAGSVAGNQSSHLNTAITLFQYSLYSLLLGPIYLIAELLNIPMNNMNNLSRKSFNKNKESFLHIPFFKMIKGCPVKKLKPEEFLLKDDMHIHQNVAVVSCDEERINKPEDKVKDNAPYVGDSFLNLFGMIPDKRKLRHHVFGLFQYIDNLRETDIERKTKVQTLFQRVSYKTLIQCYLIHKTIQDKCPSVYRKDGKTIILDEDVVNMVNPLYYSWSTPYDDKVYCMKKHVTQKKFTEEDKNKCGAPCKTCTFRNSLWRMTKKYGSSSCNKTSTLESIFNTYYKYIEVKKKVPLPATAEDVVLYLKSLTPKASALDDKLDATDKDEVIKLFHRLMCKYDILPTLEQQIKIKMKEKLAKGYSMDHLLEFI